MNAPTTQRQGNSFILGVILGGGIGFIISVLLVGVGGFVWVKKKEADVRRGWNLVPVVVASQDVPEGTVVTFDMISQRSVPEQFVTSSVVKPDSATYIVNQRILVPVQAGDMMQWSQFETRKMASGLVAARDIPAGVKLTAEDVEPRDMAPDIVTPSYVKDAERPQVVGRSVTTAFRKGDPILWTHFQNEPPPVVDAKVP
ncbi:SAF domain-containing protein [Archangium sp.]|uniref:SAF domain-containing protein n=1 Tax=Archangium sp. TaxID=1872627 RepID=UPI002ED7CBEF